MPKNPLAEIFGFPASDMSDVAKRHREMRLCPFHNSSGLTCTKNSAIDPMGVCTVYNGNEMAVTCPIRLRQDLLIVKDAADFFFPGKRAIPLTEVRLNDRYGKSAGNIDIVLVTLDDEGNVTDFGAVEVQAVYISGNVSKAFKKYMENPEQNYAMEWPARNYPKPDYLSSSRKRLAPQLIYKGGILHAWKKKSAVVVHSSFFRELPPLPEVDAADADIAWLIYDLVRDSTLGQYRLVRTAIRYTKFKDALDTITTPAPGTVEDFVNSLQQRVKKGKFMGQPPGSELPPLVEPSLTAFEEENSENEYNHDNGE